MSFPAVPKSLYPFEGRYFDRNGLQYHYLDEGSGDPVVMVHGNPTWSFYYRDLVLSLRKNHRALAPDHIGCGFSDKPDDADYPYTLSQRIEDLEAWIDSLALEQPVKLVGHDWGGMIAMGWAARHPERVASIALMNTAAFHLPPDMKMPASLAFVRDTQLASWMVGHLNLFARGAAWLAPARPLAKPLRDAYCAPYDTPAHRIATLRFVQDIPLTPGDPAYDTVSEIEASLSRFGNTPILLIWGEKDFVFKPAVLSIFEKRWPHAEAHRFPHAGHYVLEEASSDVIPLVQAFLSKNPS